MKTYLYSLVAALALVCSSNAFALDPKAEIPVEPFISQEDFDSLLPLMDCKDMTNRDQVNAQQTVQQNFQNLVFKSWNKPELKAHLNKLMVEAIGKDLPAQSKAWLLRQLRWTATPAEVPAIAQCLSKNVTFVTDEAAQTLAYIQCPEAEAALKAAQEAGTVKNKLIFSGALTNRAEDLSVPTETALPLAIPYLPKADVDKYLAGWNSFDEADKVRALAALTAREDKAYLPVVVDAIQNGSDAVKRAGIIALEKIGTADQIPLLIDFPDSGLANRIAGNIVSDGFDQALIKMLGSTEDNGKRSRISAFLTARFIDVSNTIFKWAKAKDCPNRIELFEQADKMAGKDRLGDFIDVLILVKPSKERDKMENMIAAKTSGDASVAIAKMEQYPGAELFSLIGRIGGDAAKETLNKAVQSTDSALRDGAIKAMCNWPNAQVASELFAISQNASLDKGQKIAALRAYIRVVSLPDEQIGVAMSADEKLTALQKAFDAAQRVDEKKLVISRASSVRDIKSLDFVLKFVDEQDLSETVYTAVADLAHHNFLRQPNKDKFRPAMERIIEKSKDGALVERVKRYMSLM